MSITKYLTFFVALLIGLAAGPALAVEDNVVSAPIPKEPQDLSRRGLGLAFGATSGIGIAWRQTWRNGLGYQVAGGAYIPSLFMPDANPSALWSIGLQGIDVLYQAGWIRCYLLGGLHAYGMQARVSLPPGPPNPNRPSGPIQTHSVFLNIGAGAGIEFGVSPGLSLALELPLVVGLDLAPTPSLNILLPIPNFLLLYNF